MCRLFKDTFIISLSARLLKEYLLSRLDQNQTSFFRKVVYLLVEIRFKLLHEFEGLHV